MCTVATSIWTSSPQRLGPNRARHRREAVPEITTRAQARAAAFVHGFVYALHREARRRDLQPQITESDLHKLIPALANECGLGRTRLLQRKHGKCRAVILAYGDGPWISVLGIDAGDRKHESAAGRNQECFITAARAFFDKDKNSAATH